VSAMQNLRRQDRVTSSEGVDGVSLEAESDVGVDGGGDADVGVAEEFLDYDEPDAPFQEQAGGRVGRAGRPGRGRPWPRPSPPSVLRPSADRACGTRGRRLAPRWAPANRPRGSLRSWKRMRWRPALWRSTVTIQEPIALPP
jgi:hypothetical protein